MTSRARSSASCSGEASTLASVWATPRITVTGVRSSWDSRATSCCRLVERSTSASWAASSSPVRRRSRSSALVSSSITCDVTPDDRSAPPCAARLTAVRISSPSESFRTYPEAPATSIPRTISWSSCPESATTPRSGKSAFNSRVASIPSIVGIRTSISTTSGASERTRPSASTPEPASPTTWRFPASSSDRSDSRKPALSSTTSTRIGLV